MIVNKVNLDKDGDPAYDALKGPQLDAAIELGNWEIAEKEEPVGVKKIADNTTPPVYPPASSEPQVEESKEEPVVNAEAEKPESEPTPEIKKPTKAKAANVSTARKKVGRPTKKTS